MNAAACANAITAAARDDFDFEAEASKIACLRDGIAPSLELAGNKAWLLHFQSPWVEGIADRRAALSLRRASMRSVLPSRRIGDVALRLSFMTAGRRVGCDGRAISHVMKNSARSRGSLYRFAFTVSLLRPGLFCAGGQGEHCARIYWLIETRAGRTRALLVSIARKDQRTL